MRAINIIGLILAVALIPVCGYYILETEYAYFASWDWYDDVTTYYGPSRQEWTIEGTLVSLLFVGYFIYQNIINMVKVKTTTTKVMSIIGLSLIGLNFLFDLMIFASDGGISYDEGGAAHVISGLIMIAFSIVFLVQCIWFSRGGLKKLDAELIDDEDFI